MPRRASSQPTDVELEILNILWGLGPSTVREVYSQMRESRDIVYATTKKMLLVMLQKGLVKRDEKASPHVYRAAKSQKHTQQRMLADFVQKVFDGSTKSLLVQALSCAKPSKEDLDEIRGLLDQS